MKDQLEPDSLEPRNLFVSDIKMSKNNLSLVCIVMELDFYSKMSNYGVSIRKTDARWSCNG